MISYYGRVNSEKIVSPVEADKVKVWGAWYDQFAPLIYGVILKMTDNTTISETLLQKTFVLLNKKTGTAVEQSVLCRSLLRNAYALTLDYLSSRGLKPVTKQPFGEKLPLVNLFYFELNSLKEAEAKLNMTMQEVLLNLRGEFNLFRSLTTMDTNLVKVLYS
jgi:hypothetical protein